MISNMVLQEAKAGARDELKIKVRLLGEASADVDKFCSFNLKKMRRKANNAESELQGFGAFGDASLALNEEFLERKEKEEKAKAEAGAAGGEDEAGMVAGLNLNAQITCRVKVQKRGFVVDDGREYRGWYCDDDNIVNMLQYYERADDPAEVHIPRQLTEDSFFTLEYVDGNVILEALDADPDFGEIEIYAPDDITHSDPVRVEPGHKFVVRRAFCADHGRYYNASGSAIQPPPGYDGPHRHFLVTNEPALDYWRRWGFEHQSSLDEDDRYSSRGHLPEAFSSSRLKPRH